MDNLFYRGKDRFRVEFIREQLTPGRWLEGNA